LVDVEADVADGLEPAEPARDAIQGQKRRHFAIAFVGEPSRISANRPFGRNSTSTTMMTPRAATCMVRKLRETRWVKKLKEWGIVPFSVASSGPRAAIGNDAAAFRGLPHFCSWLLPITLAKTGAA